MNFVLPDEETRKAAMELALAAEDKNISLYVDLAYRDIFEKENTAYTWSMISEIDPFFTELVKKIDEKHQKRLHDLYA